MQAVNKIDAARGDAVAALRDKLGEQTFLRSVLEISAAEGSGLDRLEQEIAALLVPGPQYFPDDMVTDQPERVVCAEMIREQALRLLSEEVPYGIGVDIDKMAGPRGRPDGDMATIYCEREGHKGIIIRGRAAPCLKNQGSRPVRRWSGGWAAASI